MCLPLLAVFWAGGVMRAEDYVLDFSTKAHSNNYYSNVWQWMGGDVEWDISCASNYKGSWAYVRFGGGSGKEGTSYVKNNQPLPIAVKEFLLDVKALNDVAKSTAFRLFVAEDGEFQQEIDVVSHAKGEGMLSFVPQNVEIWPANAYYKLEVYWQNDQSGNKGIDIVSLTFKEGVPPPVYTVTAVANDETLGTVTVEGKVITAVRGECVAYADPAYTVTEGTAEVTQEGDVFAVSPQSDCTVRINFAPAEVATVTLDAGGGTLPGASELVQADCASSVGLPEAVSPCAGWTFAGWSETSVDATETMPQLIPAGDYLPAGDVTLHAVYQYAQGGEAEQVLRMMVGATTGWEVLGTGTGGGNDEPYYIMKEGAVIYSPTLDLSTITRVSAVVRTYNNHGTLLIMDEAGNEWGRVTALVNELFTEDAEKTQDLTGVGRLAFTSATTTVSRGVGVAAITVYYRDVPVTYATYPDCDPDSGVGIRPLDHGVDWYVAGHAVHVEADGEWPFAVYDLSGHEVCNGVTRQGINRIALQAGCYLLRVGEKVQKIVIAE